MQTKEAEGKYCLGLATVVDNSVFVFSFYIFGFVEGKSFLHNIEENAVEVEGAARL